MFKIISSTLLGLGLFIGAGASAQNSPTQEPQKQVTAQPKYEKITLNNGIEITTISKGNGAKPNRTSNVEVHYRGTFKNGQEFDSSYKRGQTITFNLSQVIPCWTEGVQHMNVGGKIKLFCPSATAYGPRGAGSAVPPNSDLFFDIELINIVAGQN